MSPQVEKTKYTAPEGSQTWEYLAIGSSSLLMLCIGSVVGWNSPSFVKLLAADSPIPVSSSDISNLAACVSIGHVVGAPVHILVVDRIGRKRTVLLAALLLLISWMLIIQTKSLEVLQVARFMGGFSLGIAVCVCPMYVGEIASTKSRGAASVTLPIMLNLGMVYGFAVGPPLSIPMVAGMNLLMTICFVFLFCFMPDSPYFLGMVGRMQEAEETLEKLRGRIDASEELEIIKDSIQVKNSPAGSTVVFKEIITVPANRRALSILMFLLIAQYLGGYVVLTNYGQIILKDLASPIPSEFANLFVGIVQTLASISTAFLVDKWGRKPLILLSGIISGFSELVLALYFYTKDHTEIDVSPYALLALMFVVLIVFSLNIGTVPLTMIISSEIFASQVKAMCTCIVGIVGGLLVTISLKLYFLIAVTWGYGHGLPFFIFTAITWISVGILFYITPETKGKTFLQIQKDLTNYR